MARLMVANWKRGSEVPVQSAHIILAMHEYISEGPQEALIASSLSEDPERDCPQISASPAR